MGIMQSPGANALELSDQVRAVMQELSADFPSSVDSRIAYDPTQFVRSSINAVIVPFLEAIALVVLVVFLFLLPFRASFIPLLAFPLSFFSPFSLFLPFCYPLTPFFLFFFFFS